ncbi:MAG: cytochrome c oxidase assembly protein [Dehalococcoidia bacterium]
MRPRLTRAHAALLAGLVLAVAPGVAGAHGGAEGESWGTVWGAWSFAPAVVLGLAAAGTAYAVGLRRLWASAGTGHGIARWRAACFALGLAALALAVLSPLDVLADALFAGHMAQHLLLMMVAAPLLVLGDPGRATLWALRLEDRRRAGRTWSRARHSMWGGVALHPLAAVAAYAGVLWMWHLPALYEAAAASALVHDLEHGTMLSAAPLFWWHVVRVAEGEPARQALVLPLVIGVMLPSMALGAILSFAGSPWYAAHEASAAWGLARATDQQVGGLLMLMPATLVHLGVLGIVFARLARASGARAVHAP